MALPEVLRRNFTSWAHFGLGALALVVAIVVGFLAINGPGFVPGRDANGAKAKDSAAARVGRLADSEQALAPFGSRGPAAVVGGDAAGDDVVAGDSVEGSTGSAGPHDGTLAPPAAIPGAGSTITLPGITIPGASGPGLSLPPLTLHIPAVAGVTLPSVDLPSVNLPALPIATPTVSVPKVTVPPVTLPVTVPPVTLPVTLPTITVPPITTPPISTPLLTVPSVKVTIPKLLP